MTRRHAIAFTLSLLVAGAALAVSPQSWRVDTTDDFLAGELNGFAVTARGTITPGPRIQRVSDVTDPFVLSQATDGKGTYFIGTGNNGNLYRLRGNRLELIYKVPEPEIYALAYVNGTLIAGSSPNGKLYAIDPESGAARDLFDPEEAYIWCIVPLPDGSLLVGTGVEGRIFKVTLDGKGSVLFDSPDTHIRALGVMGTRILAGSAGTAGRIYELTSAGAGRALHESSFSEISSIAFDAAGTAWAAAVTTVLPTAAPPRQQRQTGQGGQGEQGEGTQEDTGSGAVDVSFSFGMTPAPQQAARVGASDVLRIEKDGFVTSQRRFDREIVYALRSPAAGSVDVATGPSGRIYRMTGGDLSLIASVPEKQIVSIAGSDRVLVTTTNAGAVYELDARRPDLAEFRSKPGDTARFSAFGSYAIEGTGLEGADISISFRSGNTSAPDDTWSAWQSASSGLTGRINAPPARYLQWKLEARKPPAGLSIDLVRSAYLNRNVAPQIDSVTLHDPGVVFVSASYPSSPQVLEATNPDEYGIFSSLDNPVSRDQGKRLFRKGYRTLTWRASDENGDELRYTVQFRREGPSEWLRIRERIVETSLNFDASQLPDGNYELRLIASDERSNPGQGLEATREGITMTVDNTPPVISVKEAGDFVEVTVTDALSPIVKAEYSIDAREWVQVVPVDGLADSNRETFRLTRRDIAGRMVIFRAVDAQFNVASAPVVVK